MMRLVFGVTVQVSSQTTPVGFAVVKAKVLCLLNTAYLTFLTAMLLRDKPRVYNLTKGNVPEGAVFIGRPSIWGNEFIIGRDGTREEVIEKHRLSITPEMEARAKRELKGRDLACFCDPLACHGHTWLAIANPEEFNEDDW